MRWFLSIVALAVVLSTPTPSSAGPRQAGQKCAKPGDCDVGLTCGPWDTCATPETVACQEGEFCEHFGMCTDRGGRCIAETDEDCRRSQPCRKDERCVAVDGTCHVGANSDADCSRPRGLRGKVPCDRGACTASQGICVVASDEDCEQMDGCRLRGKCTFKEGRCVVGSQVDCARSWLACREQGRCSFSPKLRGCFVGANEDCSQSRWCKERGRCTASGKMMCRAGSTDDCRQSARCVQKGLCTHHKGVCQAASDADCRQSKACKDLGHCTARNGTCADTWGYGTCVVSTEPGYDRCCLFCRQFGWCHAQVGGRCRALSDDDCRQSDVCRQAGQCTALNGSCEMAPPAPRPGATARKEAMTKWDTLCAACHGRRGDGDGLAGAALNPKPRALSDAWWQRSVDDARLRAVIVGGGPAVGLNAAMPPNPDLKRKPHVVQALVEHIRSLAK